MLAVGFECYGCNWAAAWVRRGIGRFGMLRDNGLGSPAGGHGAGQALLLYIPSVLQLATRDFLS